MGQVGIRGLLVSLQFAVLLLVFPPSAAVAGGFVGDGTPESCTFTAFKSEVTAGGVVLFNCGPEPHTIPVEERLDITLTTRIDGGHLITLDGGGADGMLYVKVDVDLEVNNLTFANGLADFGAAIFNHGGTVTVTESTFSNNRARHLGGAIHNHNDGLVTIANSTFVANTALTGGAIYSLHDRSSLTISTSTFSENHADGQGGAIYNRTSPVSISNSTFALNTASVEGNAIYNYSDVEPYIGPVVIDRSIVTSSSDRLNCAGIVSSGSHVLSSDFTCASAEQGDLSATDPNLAPLRDNGGPTWTHHPRPNSPAIDASSATCAATDQRGVSRPHGSACDIGAVEAADATPPTSTKPVHAFARLGVARETGTQVRISWDGSDDSDEPISWTLQKRVVGGSNWKNVTLSSPESTSRSMSLAYEKRYRFRVRGTDAWGNTGAWRYGELFSTERYEETASGAAYSGSWTPQTAAFTYGGSTTHADTNASSMTFTFDGTSVAWVAVTGPGRGLARVLVDGVFLKTVDLSATSVSGRKIVWTTNGLADGPHTLEIRVRGIPGSGSSGTRVDVAGFVVLD